MAVRECARSADGELDSYGVELVLNHVAATPTDTTAADVVGVASGGGSAFPVDSSGRGARAER
jgi:hypothetical protein